MKNTETLLKLFLDRAKDLTPDVEVIRVLKSNTYKIANSNVLVRTASDLGKRYFFGLNYINAEELYNLDNSYFAFICGSIDKVVFIPSEILIKYLPEISHDRNGEYKINFKRNFNLVLKGRNRCLDCSDYLNNWDIVLRENIPITTGASADESIHSVIQGRLIDIGNIRGFLTYSPDKSRIFNKRK